ncbi:superoxide dismutase [Salinicola avicenniae]|uniref:superoxide dismutase n=1 Tax=Salinicola avicenniae TaxID=2916836 RepID=UPI0020735E73|nr:MULTISPECIES: superoxide dismutase [unclassified Salinicola]
MTYELPTLNYRYDALKPHIDRLTMEIHHTRHHQTYINNLNEAVAAADIPDMPVERLIADIDALPESSRTAVRHNGGGHTNHSLFWQVLTPDSTAPEGELAAAIDRELGGLQAFREAFSTTAKGRFGSGWAWLGVDKQGRLCLESSANQDNPLMGDFAALSGATPILGLDVWEHAYYLAYQNRRPDYIEAFFEIIDWREVARRYHQASAGGHPGDSLALGRAQDC